MNAIVPQTGLTEEQHAARADAVGASEVDEALFSPASVWLRKTGREAREEDDALSRLGQCIEPFIVGECMRSREIATFHKPDTLRRGRMIAHLDTIAEFEGRRINIEAKWRGHRDGWGEPGSADVPRSILLQTQAQMHIAGIELTLVPVLFLRPPVVVYEVAYDAELGSMIEEGVDRFWRFVESDTPPPVNPDMPEALAVLRKLYPGTNGERLSATADLEHWRAVYSEASIAAKRYGETADSAKAHLLMAMGEAAELAFSDGKLLRRKLVKVKGYTVEPREQIDARFVNAKE